MNRQATQRKMISAKIFENWVPLAALALLLPWLTPAVQASADEFAVEPGPPTVSEINLTENDGQVFTGIQPAYSSSEDRYNVSTSIGLPGGHDDLQKLTMCWYLFDFEDCSDTNKINSQPEAVFKVTHEVVRIGENDDDSSIVTGETFRVNGSNNYEINVAGHESSTSTTREEDGSANVDVTFTFKASNAMRSSSNWKVYIEAEDRFGQTGSAVREGVRVKYFSAMTLERDGVDFGAVAKGETSTRENIDSGNYTANAQSQFFINATDFSAGNGSELGILRSGNLGPNQVELRCARSASFDSNTAQLVTDEGTEFGTSIPPSSENPIDADDHSCSVRFGVGRAEDPNITYTNTFTLAIGASPVTAPQDLQLSNDVLDSSTQVELSFEPPQIVQEGNATLDSYRIEVVNLNGANRVTEQTIRADFEQLQAGALGYTDSTIRLTQLISDLTASTEYEFFVEANTSVGAGSISSNADTALTKLYEFQQATFTPGSSGRFGPSEAQILRGLTGNSELSDASENADFLNVSSGVITWTVPADGTYRIDARGAQGGSGYRHSGGRGARMVGEFDLNLNDQIKIMIGQLGESNSLSAGGGGGGTFVLRDGAVCSGSTPVEANILVIAGGGGGGGGSQTGGNGVTGENGSSRSGHAGGTNGRGAVYNEGDNDSGSGGGGLCTNGHSIELRYSYSRENGGEAYVNGGVGGERQGSYPQGGFGGFGGGASGGERYDTNRQGGGGGGGFSGGAGGEWSNGQGGGGGGSFLNDIAANTVQQGGVNGGHGSVTIELVSTN